ncbi:MAG: hypothetical protein P8I94_02430, partial [Emcibacteraceae bacterium]|nr:hypothetical protein [Emcibacteraceae bacterium]
EKTIQGHVQFLSFSILEKKLSKAWPRFRISIYEKVDAVLDEILSEDDVYLRTSDYFYLVAFNQVDLEKAKSKLDRAREIIIQHYLGIKFYDEENKKERSIEKLEVLTSEQIIESNVFIKDLELIGSLYKATETQVSDNVEMDNETANKIKPVNIDKLKFLPYWDTKSETIIGYQACLKDITDITKSRYLRRFRGSSECFADRQKTDFDTLNEAIEITREAYFNKFVFLSTCPLSFATIKDPEVFAQYVRICRNQPRDIQKLLNIELVEFPVGYPGTRLGEVVQLLSPYIRNIIFNTPLEGLKFYEAAVEAGIKIVSVDVKKSYETKNIEKLTYYLQVFCRKLRKAGITISLNGVSQLEVAMLARRSGIRFISGDLIGKPTEIPNHMSRYKWEEIKKDRFK